MFNHLLESSHRDDSNKWSNIGFGEEITQVESIEDNFTHLIWSSVGPMIILLYYSCWNINHQGDTSGARHKGSIQTANLAFSNTKPYGVNIPPICLIYTIQVNSHIIGFAQETAQLTVLQLGASE